MKYVSFIKLLLLIPPLVGENFGNLGPKSLKIQYACGFLISSFSEGHYLWPSKYLGGLCQPPFTSFVSVVDCPLFFFPLHNKREEFVLYFPVFFKESLKRGLRIWSSDLLKALSLEKKRYNLPLLQSVAYKFARDLIVRMWLELLFESICFLLI